MSQSDYLTALDAVIGRYKEGKLDKRRFKAAFQDVVRQGLHDAWLAGSMQYDIAEDEWTDEERAALEEVIDEQIVHVSRFADEIETVKKTGAEWDGIEYRTGLWASKWELAQTMGASYAGSDMKMKWRLGETEEHCLSCDTFDGRVYRFHTWRENKALPRSSALKCGGYNCDCGLEPTSDPLSRGRFPKSVLSLQEDDDGHLILFNPYHDKLGKFTSAPHGKKTSLRTVVKSDDKSEAGKQWIKDHKKELALTAGVLAAAGITAYVVHKKRNDAGHDVVIAQIKGKHWDGEIEVNFGDHKPDAEDARIAALSSSYAAAATSHLEALGVNIGQGKKIVMHRTDATFEEAMGGKGSADYARAFIDPKDPNKIHMGRDVTTDMLVAEIYDPLKEMHERALGTFAHELYHAREGGDELDRLYYANSDNAMHEEFLARTAATLVSMRHFEDDTLKEDFDRNLSVYGFPEESRRAEEIQEMFKASLSGPEWDLYHHVGNIAQTKARNDDDYSNRDQVFLEWLRGSAGDTLPDMRNWLLVMFSDEDIESDNAYPPPVNLHTSSNRFILFNPYHDKLGRFTSSPHAKSKSGQAAAPRMTVETDSKSAAAKKWASEHKKELAIAGGLMAAAGVTAVAVAYYSKRGESVAHCDGRWRGEIRYKGLLSDPKIRDLGKIDPSLIDDIIDVEASDSADFIATCLIAQNTMEELGIDLPATHSIVGYSRPKDYMTALVGKEKLAELARLATGDDDYDVDAPGADFDADVWIKLPKTPLGFARKGVCHLSPSLVETAARERRREREYGTRPAGVEGLRVIAHELTHARRTRAGKQKYKYDAPRERMAQEGLADWVALDVLKKNFPEIGSLTVNEQSRYFAGYRSTWRWPFECARAKSAATGRSVSDIRNEWLRSINPARDMKKWSSHIPLGTLVRIEQLARDMWDFDLSDIITHDRFILFNPYHDKLGKFTSSPHGKGGLAQRMGWNKLTDDQKRKVKIAAVAVGATAVVAGAGYVIYKRRQIEPTEEKWGMYRAQSRHDEIVDHLRSGRFRQISDAGEGITVARVVASDRMYAIEKDSVNLRLGDVVDDDVMETYDGGGLGLSGREEAFYLMARDMGWEDIVPPTVAFRKHGVIPTSRTLFLDDFENDLREKDPKQGDREIFIMDSLALNSDRNAMNRGVGAEGTRIAIDHGFSFPGRLTGDTLEWPSPFHKYWPKAVKRRELNKFELGRVRRLVERKDITYPKLARLIGRDAADIFYRNVDFAVNRGELPPFFNNSMWMAYLETVMRDVRYKE